jgi:hypothetical protein
MEGIEVVWNAVYRWDVSFLCGYSSLCTKEVPKYFKIRSIVYNLPRSLITVIIE